VFYSSSETSAFVNLRPIVPGHVLVCPKRSGVKRLRDLTDAEYEDLWRTVRKVQEVVEDLYEASASNVAVQDGIGAGQSVPHVHVHILPRSDGDFERNDDVYSAIEGWGPWRGEEGARMDVPDDGDRKDRTVADMEEEAGKYRSLLASQK